MADSIVVATWNLQGRTPEPPLVRLDAIFVSSDLRAAARVPAEWRGSDHCPVVARVEVSDPDARLGAR